MPCNSHTLGLLSKGQGVKVWQRQNVDNSEEDLQSQEISCATFFGHWEDDNTDAWL